MTKIFIDGEHGTTGLQIRERIAGRADITQLTLAHEDRRDNQKRADLLAAADIAILCLPDDGAREAVAMVEAAGADTRFIDASTAHRSADDWVYGFAELTQGHANEIASASRVSNPGCYSTGAIALIRPLVESGIMPADFPLTLNGVSGYSGGGKQLIAQMEDASNADHLPHPYFAYALSLQHKHVPEIMKRCGLTSRPIFTPNVGRYKQGMLVSLPLHLDVLPDPPSLARVHEALADHYAGQDVVQVVSLEVAASLPRLDPEALNGSNTMRLYVTGNDEAGQALLVAQLDNLGKGASGAAVQNLDLMIRG